MSENDQGAVARSVPDSSGSLGEVAKVGLNLEKAARQNDAQAIHHALREDRPWQRRMLPYMTFMVVGLSLFFCAVSVIQVVILDRRLSTIPDIPALMDKQLASTSDKFGQMSSETAARFFLEAHALQRRYQQANALLITRIWTKYVGFLTGMIMAMFGATFILGKIREESSSLAGKLEGKDFSFSSSSPGLFLALFGTAILLSALFAQQKIEVEDAPIYVGLPVSAVRSLASPEVLPPAASDTTIIKPDAKPPK